MSTLSKDKVGIFHYTLTTTDGELIDSSDGRDPLPYLHGNGNIVSGLEREMEGKSVGDSFTTVVAPEEAYGLLDESEDAYMEVGEERLPEGMEFQKGFPIHAELEDGTVVTFYMHDYADGVFTLTQNHPLAGVTLVFAIEVVGIRDASTAELEDGQPHGLDGTDRPSP